MANEGDQWKSGEPFDKSKYSDLRNALEDSNVPTKSVVGRAAGDERAFVADTGEITVSDTVRGLLENASTDRMIVIYRFEWYNGGGDDYFAQIYKNPDTGLPTTEQNYINLYSKADNSEPSTVANFFVDSGTTSLSGGVATGVEVTVPQGPDQEDFLYYLEPQSSVGFNLSTGGALTDATAKFALFYFEVPI